MFSKTRLIIILWLFSLLLSLPTRSVAEDTLPQQAYDSIGSAVFEVIVPKPTKDSLKYKDPLPFNSLPFALRNDRYYSIGTAFAIGPNLFVSAAHVMNLGVNSQWGEPSLRDRNGTVYSIDKITKYSERRDFVVFTVKNCTVEKPFIPNLSPKMNQRVFAVGNALGEGVVIRDGQYTSDTPEEEDGAWKWLRFSAAASPGNSGGPLLDGEGKVIGIVLRKSPNENLNLALPIAEILNAKNNMAQIHRKTEYALPIMTRITGKTVDTYLALPRSIQDLNGEIAEYVALYHHYDAKNYFSKAQERLFPNGSGAKPLLSSPPSAMYPFLLKLKDDGFWEASEVKATSVDLGNNGWIAYGDLGNSFVFTMHKPDDVSLERIYTDGKLFMDMVLRGIRLSRNVGNNPIRITSFGPQFENYTFRDNFGRIWLVKSWLREFDDSKAVTFSLPTPEGLMTLMRIGQTGEVDSFHIPTLKILTNFIGFSYTGTMKEWEEFVRHKELLPPSLERLGISRQNNGLFLSSPRLEVAIENEIMQLSDKSILSLLMGFNANKDNVTWDINTVIFLEDQATRKLAAITRHSKPYPELNREFHEFWETLVSRKFPYNKSANNANGSTEIMTVVESAGVKDPDMLYTLHYVSAGVVTHETMLDTLDKLLRGLTVKETASSTKTGEIVRVPLIPYEGYQRIMQEEPRSALRYALQGQIHAENDDLARAMQSYEKAIAIDPRCEVAYNGRGMIYLKRGDFNRALADYGKAIEINPFGAEALNNRGDIFLKRGQYDEAIEELGKALAITPKMSITYNNRAKAYMEIKRHSLALSDYTRVIELDPTNSDSYYNRGNLYRSMKNYESAISDFDRAIELNDRSALAYYGRGFLFAEIKEHEKAIQDYGSALSINPEYADAYRNRSAVYSAIGEYDKAISDYGRIINSNNASAKDLLNRGNLYKQTFKTNQALSDYSAAIKLKPDFLDPYIARGLIYKEKGDFRKAVEDFSRAIEIDPRNFYSYVTRGQCLLNSGENENAFADFSIALEIDPKNVDAYTMRGYLNKLKGNFQMALGDLDRAIALAPDFWYAYLLRGEIHGRKGALDKALSDFDRAAELEPRNADIYNSRGYTFFMRKEFNRALADYNRAIDINPKAPVAYQNRGNLYASEFRDAFKACQDWKSACDLGVCVNLNTARQAKICR